MKLFALLFAAGLAITAAPVSVKVQVNRRVVEVPLEKYVAAVLAGEASVFRSDEALKAMSITARTYAIRMRGRHQAEGFDFCTTTHCQRVDLDGPSTNSRLQKIAAATAGELLWYRGKLAFTPYSLDCGGRTEDVSAVWPDEAAPYLKSRADEYCVRVGAGDWHWTGDAIAIANALRKQGLNAPAHLTSIRIAGRTPSGRARVLHLSGDGSIPIAASALRFAIGRELGWATLRSDWFDIHAVGEKIRFDGHGSGHGVGLCQRGADAMGTEGHSYREILAYYFPETEIGASARGFEWKRFSGQGIVLYTSRPDRDASILAAAERDLHDWSGRTGWTLSSPVEIRVYPDAQGFRNATGEPGWVAAYTHGLRIEMQPASGAERTLRHEILHVFIESKAAPSLPLWFREGLVECLGDGFTAHAKPVRFPSDQELRQTTDAAAARRAYARAEAAVADLASRYGERTLFTWVTQGLPSFLGNGASRQTPQED